jgi:glycosyltransferase involved in cell wall biosynthesis
VIINNYNYGRFLPAAIESALGQTYPNVRVIVVDDGSTDDSRAVMRSFGGRIVSVLKENGGQASAFNAGFARSSGDLVVFLDSDDVLLPDAVERIVAVAETDPAAVRIQYPKEVIDAAGRATGIVRPSPHIPLASGDLREAALTRPFDLASVPTGSFRSWALRRLLPIPEDEFAECADWYLVHLAALLGPVAALEAPAYGYRVHGGNRYEPKRPRLDLEHVRQSVRYAAATRRHLLRLADELGRTRPHDILSVADLANRLISRRLDPERHPIPDDRTPALALNGIRAALRRSDVSPVMRLMFVAWFLGTAALPRGSSRRLGERFLFPERRPRLNRALARMHRGGRVEAP